MTPISVVIITKNEAAIIAQCINMAQLLSKDIIIIDSGSTDETVKIARQYGCRVYNETWDGYGANKNKGIALATNNWILSLDADEVIDMELVGSIHRLTLQDPTMVYDIQYKLYFGQKQIHFGSWGKEHHLRLFNRTHVRWCESMVHERLVLPKFVKTRQVAGYIHHYTVNNAQEYIDKTMHYAWLGAQQYLRQGRKFLFFKRLFSPTFGFFKNYFIRLGFLDGKEGLQIAKINYKSTYFKYHYLNTHHENISDSALENLALSNGKRPSRKQIKIEC